MFCRLLPLFGTSFLVFKTRWPYLLKTQQNQSSFGFCVTSPTLSMADGDSLYELSSDQDVDPDAMDGDVENDDTADDW